MKLENFKIGENQSNQTEQTLNKKFVEKLVTAEQLKLIESMIKTKRWDKLTMTQANVWIYITKFFPSNETIEASSIDVNGNKVE